MIKANPWQRKYLARGFLRLYMRLALVALGVFFVVSLFHPGFLTYGSRHLARTLADESLIVNALVLPPPATPNIAGDLTCNPLNLSLAHTLTWSTDPGGGTFGFELYRNGLPMALSLPSTTTSYVDTNLAIATTYSYVLRAIGPMGPGAVDSLSYILTTPYNCDGLTTPVVEVSTFDGRAVASFSRIAYTSKRRPVVTGTSNIPYAQIQITIDEETKMVAYATANYNGYWEWRPTARLNFERATMFIRATDPLNGLRYANTSLDYQIIRPDEKTPSDDDETTVNRSSLPPLRQGLVGTPSNPEVFGVETLRFDFDTVGKVHTFFQGDRVDLALIPRMVPETLTEQGVVVRFRLLDKNGENITTQNKSVFLRTDEQINGNISIPLYVRPGEYQVAVDFVLDGVLYSKTQTITVDALPVILLGGGRVITYDQLMWNMGWIILAVLLLFLLGGFSFLYEYWLYLQGRNTVSERDVQKIGYFSRL